MATVSIPSTQPTQPTQARTLGLVPYQSTVMRRIALGAIHAATWDCTVVGSCHWDYDTTTTPLIEQDPAGVDQALYVYLTEIPARTKHLMVAVRAQATSDKGGALPTLTISLEELDGTEIDKGMTWPAADLLRGEIDGREWPLNWVLTPIRIFDGLATLTSPRMLNVDTFQGSAAQVKLVTEDCRVTAACVLAYVPPEDDQVFSA